MTTIRIIQPPNKILVMNKGCIWIRGDIYEFLLVFEITFMAKGYIMTRLRCHCSIDIHAPDHLSRMPYGPSASGSHDLMVSCDCC